MNSAEDIKKQLKHLDISSRILGVREIKSLPDILWEDEKLEKLVQGFYEKGNGILIATNKRLLFVDKGLIYGLRTEDFPYDKISSIKYEAGLLFGKIVIYASGNKAEISQIEKKRAKDFCDYVRARCSSTQKHASIKEEGGDMEEQLKKLASYKEKGLISEKDYADKKKKILGL